MSKKERQRLLVLSRVRDQGMTLKQAAKVLDMSYRQTRRNYKRWLDEGDAGLVHKSRGKVSNRGLDLNLKQAVLDLYKKTYAGFGPTLAAEKLLEEDALIVDHETLRRWPDIRRTVAKTAQKIDIPGSAHPKRALRRARPDGRQSPPLVRGSRRRELFDEYG